MLASQCSSRLISKKTFRILLRCFLSFQVHIFLTSCFAAAHMPFLLVLLQNASDFAVKPWIDGFQSVRYVFMYGRFADVEVRGAVAHGCARLQYVFRAAHRTPFHILPHNMLPRFSRCYILCRILPLYDGFFRPART